MHQAAVGFQCPECFKGTRQRVYTARSLQASEQPHATLALIAINVAVYLFGLFVGGFHGLSTPDQFVDDGGLVAEAIRVGNHIGIPTGPVLLGPSSHLIGVAHGQWWRLVTSGFLHAGILHIAFNMFALYVLGMLLERMIGSWRFVLIYAVSLLAGSLGALIVTPHSVGVGASGAIFGLFGGLIVAARVKGFDLFRSGLITWLVIDLVFTFTIPGISIGAHVGGLIGGFVVSLVLIGLPEAARTLSAQARRIVPVVLSVALGAVCIAASLAVASSNAVA